MPGREGQFPSWLEYSQHLANCVHRRWKEHHAEAAYYRINCIGWERQMVCRGDVELCIPELRMVCRSTSGFHHLRRRIDPEDLAFGADQGSYGQCRLSGTRSNIQNCMPTANQPILDKSLCDRRKHLPDDFAVFLPERRGITPYAYKFLVRLHQQKYTGVVDGQSGSNPVVPAKRETGLRPDWLPETSSGAVARRSVAPTSSESTEYRFGHLFMKIGYPRPSF